MRVLTVRHVTTYRYSEPVEFGEHRMMFRPRESHDLRLLSTKLAITPPPADIRWLHDVFDNSVAIATFETAASELRFDSTITLELTETPLPDYALASGAHTYPFRYSDDERADLFGGLTRQYPSDDLGPWVGRFLKSSGSTNTMTLLDSMTRGIKE
jgi:transglutaminase-like putative cysteine protease